MLAAFPDDNAAEEAFADDSEFASYEVGAGLGGSRSFLRGTLADDDADDDADDERAEPNDEPRELRVRDKLARLDAGLPPLPPGEYPDESLMPPPRRPAPAAESAPPAAAPPVAPPVEEPVEIEREVVLKALEPDEEVRTARRAVPAPGLFRPLVEADEEADEGEAAADPPAPTLRRDPAPEPKPAAPARRSIFRSFRG